MSTSCAPCKYAPYALHMLTHSVLSIGLWNRYYPHVTDKKTEVYRRETLSRLLKIQQDVEVVFESRFASVWSPVSSTVVYKLQDILLYLSSFFWMSEWPLQICETCLTWEIEVYSNVFMNSRRSLFWMIHFYVSRAFSIELYT